MQKLVPQMGDGFLQKWCTWADGQTDAPSQFHVHAGLLLLSTIAPDGIEIEFGRMREKPNLYVLIAGLSGRARKSTAIGMVGRMLRRLCDERGAPVLLGASFGSFAKMVERLSERKVQLVIETEFSRMLANAGRGGYLSDLKLGLTDAFDCSPVSSDTYKHGSVVARDYRMSFGAAISYDYLSQYGEAEDFTGGFLSRFLIAAADRERYLTIGESGPEVVRQEEELLDMMMNIVSYAPSGSYRFDKGAFATYAAFVNHLEEYSAGAQKKIQGVYDRAPLMIRKISCLFAMERLTREGARSGSVPSVWEITEADVLPTLHIVSAHLAGAQVLVRTVENTPEARLRAHVLDVIPTDKMVPLGYITARVKRGRRAVKSIVEDLIGEGLVTEGGNCTLDHGRIEMTYFRNDNSVPTLAVPIPESRLHPPPQAEYGPLTARDIPALPTELLGLSSQPTTPEPATPKKRKRALTAEEAEIAHRTGHYPDDDE